ncbi:MAG: hypothetical protein K0R71_155 [Bacillales bacterium]|jgi:hypothetical protein|nr:hypothetical protein [Bacillales bacterium]
MKKWILIFIGIVIAIIIVNLNLSNGFSNIDSIKVQKYDESSNEYNDGKVIKDSNSIKNFTKTLNRANQEKNAFYSTAHRDDFKVTITYEDDTTEVLFVWKDFGGNTTFIVRPTKHDVFRVKNENHRKAFLKILNM